MTTVATSEPAPTIQPARHSATRVPHRAATWKWLGGSALVVVLAAAAYFSFGATARHGPRAAETYEVVRRSFSVVLNEKGELDATKSENVKCEVEGRSTIIWLIPEGTEVAEGDLLVKLASNEIEEKVQAEEIKAQNTKAAAEAAEKELAIMLDQNASDIRKAELAQRNAKIELNKYLKGDFIQERLEKELALETARRTLVRDAGILEDSRQLRDKGFLTERDFQQKELNKHRAEVEVQKSQVALDTFLEYTHDKNDKQKRSDVQEASKDLDRTRNKAAAQEAKQRATTTARQAESKLTQQRLDKLLEQQRKTDIYAPATGLVVYDAGEHRWDPRQIAEGSEVWERQSIIKLPDTSQMKAKLRIHEAKTSKIALDQPATIEIEGIPGAAFTGKVTKIAPLADSQNRWLNPNLKEYDTEITLDPTERELKPGVTARVTILVRDVQDVLAIPVQAVFSRGDDTFAFVGDGQSDAKPMPIEVGSSSDEYVEVRSGLAEHDTVLLAATDALLAKLPTNQKKGMANGARKRRPPAGARPQQKRKGGGES